MRVCSQATYNRVDPAFGEWEEIEKTAEETYF